jgi:hypothetical protein
VAVNVRGRGVAKGDALVAAAGSEQDEAVELADEPGQLVMQSNIGRVGST